MLKTYWQNRHEEKAKQMETEGILGKQQQVSISSPRTAEGASLTLTQALRLTLLETSSKMSEIEFNELIFFSKLELGQFGIAE